MDPVSFTIRAFNIFLGTLILFEFISPVFLLPGISGSDDTFCLGTILATIITFFYGIFLIISLGKVRNAEKRLKTVSLVAIIIIVAGLFVGLGPTNVAMMIIASYVFVFPMAGPKERSILAISVVFLCLGGATLIIPFLFFNSEMMLLSAVISIPSIFLLMISHGTQLYLNSKCLNRWVKGPDDMEEREMDTKPILVGDDIPPPDSPGGSNDMKPRELEAPPGFS